MLTTKVVVIAVAGALGAALANRGIAVYADGLRPVVPELVEGRMARPELASISFGLSFGLWITFSLPFSFASAILLVHSLWLGTDLIGTRLPGRFDETWRRDTASIMGLLGSLVIGGLYGVILVLGLDAFIGLSQNLPVDVFGALEALADPVILSFAAFPAVVVGYQYGRKQGILVLLLSVLGWLGARILGHARPDLWALAVGIVVLILYAVRERATTGEAIATAAVFATRARRIRHNLPAIALMGAVYGVASHLAILMEGAQSSIALGNGDTASATAMTIARAFSLTPLKGMTALSTGVFATDGLGFVATAGLMSPNAAVALFAGAVVMSLEAFGLASLAHFLDRFPGMQRLADSMRTAMVKVLEVATLVGGMMAANTMAPALGIFVVAGLSALNEVTGTPVVRVAIGPLAAILVGIAINILALLGLYTPTVLGAGF